MARVVSKGPEFELRDRNATGFENHAHERLPLKVEISTGSSGRGSRRGRIGGSGPGPSKQGSGFPAESGPAHSLAPIRS